MGSQSEEDSETTGKDSFKFIPIYDRYLEDRHSFESLQTENHGSFVNDPQQALREWFDAEGHELNLKVEPVEGNQFVCTLDLPIDEHDFTITSDPHNKKNLSVKDACLLACKLLDECQLLYSWQLNTKESEKEDSDKRQLFKEANKEDDIELDSTGSQKRHCGDKESSTTNKVNTYESLMAKWNELNMSILQLKAKLVKLDLSVAKKPASARSAHSNVQDASSGHSDEDEVDPLDEFMSTLDTKTKLSMDDKIEKSRLKTQIAGYEREQSEISKLIALAKPSFDLNKACQPSKASSAHQKT